MYLAVSSMIFASVVSCKDTEENKDEVLEMETEETAMDNMNNMKSMDTSMTDKKELENTQMVPTGTYTGEAIIVDAQQNEVYVRLNDTTTIELYFSNDTQIMQNGQKVAFDALQQGQKVEVDVEKSGESLKPLAVRIVE